MKLFEVDITGYDTILLDRDGVINRLRPNDYVKCWKEFDFLPEVKETIAKWSKQVKYIFVVTNQRGVGKGLMTESDLADVHSKMVSEIEAVGGRIDRIYYCTSLTEEDIRRKPGRGMFDDILSDYPDVTLEHCLMVGDAESDMQFANNCGIKGIKI